MIDTKFSIHAKHKEKRYLVTEENGLLFLARDAALPATLVRYREECERLGSDLPHLKSIDKLILDVEQFQHEVDRRVPGVDTLPQELQPEEEVSPSAIPESAVLEEVVPPPELSGTQAEEPSEGAPEGMGPQEVEGGGEEEVTLLSDGDTAEKTSD